MLNLISAIHGTGVAASTNSYESIATTTLGAGGATSITFSSIPATYKHLQLRGIMQFNTGDGSTGFDRMRVTVNSDTGANYAQHQLYGTGASAAASSATSQNNMLLGAISYSNNTNVFAPSIIDVLDYASTNKYKTFRVLTGGDRNSTDGLIYLQSGLWMNSGSAITSITLGFDGSRNYTQYSSFALYGIKG